MSQSESMGQDITQLTSDVRLMDHPKIIATRTVDTPAGRMCLGAYEGALCMADWADSPTHERILKRLTRVLGAELVEADDPVTLQAEALLRAYFDGRLTRFDIPLLLVGTEFQRRVWQALMTIDYGATVSYRDVADMIGNPGAVRAVAAAVGANAISVIVPCHRVIGADGSLTGYAGGLQAKARLLTIEKARVGDDWCLPL